MSGIARLLLIAGFVLAILSGGVAGYLSVEPQQPAPLTAAETPTKTPDIADAEPAPAEPAPPVAESGKEAGDYGPDWPVCRDMSNDPRQRYVACTTLLDKKVLSIQHQSWALNNRGTALHAMGQDEAAGKDFLAAIDLDQKNEAPYVNLANLTREYGRPVDALKFIDEAITLNPADSFAYCVKAAALSELGRLEDGMATLAEAAKLGPLPNCGLEKLAELQEKRGDTEQALATLAKVEGSDRSASRALCDRGRLLSAQGKDKEAFDLYVEAMRLDPQNKCAVTQASYLSMYVMDFAKALSFVEANIAAHPDFKRLNCYRGAIFVAQDRIREALAIFNDTISAAPTEACGYSYRAGVTMRQGDYLAALADYEIAVQLDPKWLGPWYGLGEALSKLGRWSDALQTYDQALKFEPSDPTLLERRGDINFLLQSYKLAAADYDQVLRINPGDVHILLRLAKADLAALNPRAAVDACDALEADAAELPACQIVKAQSFLVLNQSEAALDALQVKAGSAAEQLDKALLATGILLMNGDAAGAESLVGKVRSSDPYGVAWAMLAARAKGGKAPADLVALSKLNDIWPQPILRWLAGDLDAQSMLAEADTPDLHLSQQRRSEAEFYLGLAAFLDGDEKSAAKHFQSVARTGYVSMDRQSYPALYSADNSREWVLAKWILADRL
jgi:tetratricopeptide (TPR) repeat protein